MTMMTREQQIQALEQDWATNPRWTDVTRGYSAADVVSPMTQPKACQAAGRDAPCRGWQRWTWRKGCIRSRLEQCLDHGDHFRVVEFLFARDAKGQPPLAIDDETGWQARHLPGTGHLGVWVE